MGNYICQGRVFPFVVGYVGCLDPDSVATHSNLPGWYTPAVGLLILVARNEPFSRDFFRLEYKNYSPAFTYAG